MKELPNLSYREQALRAIYNIGRILTLGFLFKHGKRVDLTEGMKTRREKARDNLKKKIGLK